MVEAAAWALLCLCLLPPAAYGVWRRRAARRLTWDQCPQCAYDLAGCLDRCSECGWVVPYHKKFALALRRERSRPAGRKAAEKQ